jgi:hypothetical protein
LGEPSKIFWQFDSFGRKRGDSGLVDAQRQRRSGIAGDRHIRSRQALEEFAHIDHEIADDREITQRLEAQRRMSIPYIFYPRNARKPFDAINSQGTRTA